MTGDQGCLESRTKSKENELGILEEKAYVLVLQELKLKA